jgi:hypothetical protein
MRARETSRGRPRYINRRRGLGLGRLCQKRFAVVGGFSGTALCTKSRHGVGGVGGSLVQSETACF